MVYLFFFLDFDHRYLRCDIFSFIKLYDILWYMKTRIADSYPFFFLHSKAQILILVFKESKVES